MRVLAEAYMQQAAAKRESVLTGRWGAVLFGGADGEEDHVVAAVAEGGDFWPGEGFPEDGARLSVREWMVSAMGRVGCMRGIGRGKTGVQRECPVSVRGIQVRLFDVDSRVNCHSGGRLKLDCSGNAQQRWIGARSINREFLRRMGVLCANFRWHSGCIRVG